MSQQKENIAQPLFTLPIMNNGTDLSMTGGTTKTPSPPPRRGRRRILFVVVALVLLAGLAVGVLYTLFSKPSSPSYQYTQVTQGDLSLTVQATGPVQSPATYDLSASTNGIIKKIDVVVGQKVSQGQVLAELDTTALQDAVNEQQATVNADQDSLYNLEVSTGWVVTPAVTQAEDTLKIAQAQFTAAQHNLDSATLRAPHAGIVTAINGTVGGTPGVSLNSSTSGGNYFIQIVDLSTLQVAANVNEADIANLKVGDPVQFTVDAYGDRQFSGKVASISSNGVASSNVVSFPVIINVDMKSLQGTNLRPGMTAAATITVLQRQNVLLIPVSAISFAHPNDGTGDGSATLVSLQDTNTAMDHANQILASLESQHPAIAAENPTAAFVIERPNHSYIAAPVVLGITDGTSYEILAGLSLNQNVLVGSGTSPSNDSSNNTSKGG